MSSICTRPNTARLSPLPPLSLLLVVVVYIIKSDMYTQTHNRFFLRWCRLLRRRGDNRSNRFLDHGRRRKGVIAVSVGDECRRPRSSSPMPARSADFLGQWGRRAAELDVDGVEELVKLAGGLQAEGTRKDETPGSTGKPRQLNERVADSYSPADLEEVANGVTADDQERQRLAGDALQDLDEVGVIGCKNDGGREKMFRIYEKRSFAHTGPSGRLRPVPA